MAQGSTSDVQNKAAESGGNLEKINLQLQTQTLAALTALVVEMRIQNDLLVTGLNIQGVDLNALRTDPSYGG